MIFDNFFFNERVLKESMPVGAIIIFLLLYFLVIELNKKENQKSLIY